MYVKEDLILPQTNTFYDFIVTKARGKSGPLFSFDVQEDIRLVSDGTERQETHAGKVVLRGWYVLCKALKLRFLPMPALKTNFADAPFLITTKNIFQCIH